MISMHFMPLIRSTPMFILWFFIDLGSSHDDVEEMAQSSQESLVMTEDSISSMDIDLNALEKVCSRYVKLFVAADYVAGYICIGLPFFWNLLKPGNVRESG